MIVRILADNQYRMNDEQMAEVDRLDDSLEVAINNNDESGFHTSLARLIEYIQKVGEVIPVEEIVSSDIIIPSDDMSLDEAREQFTPYNAPDKQATEPEPEGAS